MLLIVESGRNSNQQLSDRRQSITRSLTREPAGWLSQSVSQFFFFETHWRSHTHNKPKCCGSDSNGVFTGDSWTSGFEGVHSSGWGPALGFSVLHPPIAGSKSRWMGRLIACLFACLPECPLARWVSQSVGRLVASPFGCSLANWFTWPHGLYVRQRTTHGAANETTPMACTKRSSSNEPSFVGLENPRKTNRERSRNDRSLANGSR